MIIIDSSSIAYRSYFALQKADLKTPDGRESGAVYGFLQTLLSLKKSFPDHDMVAVFDSAKPSFRRDYYEGYKANRERMPEPLVEQVEALLKNLPLFGCPVLKMEKFEADDIIASLVKTHSSSGEIMIVSKDKDLAQLVKSNIFLIYPGKSGDWDVMNEKTVKVKFGVEPSQIKDFLVLTGDASDNIPGVPGVGPRTAAKLLQKCGDLDEIIRNPEIYTSKKIALSIRNSKDIIDRAKKLIELKTDLEVPDIEELKNKKVSNEFVEFLTQWGMKKMARELGLEVEENVDLERGEKSLAFESGFISASYRDGTLLWAGEEFGVSGDRDIFKKRTEKNILVSDDTKKIMVDENITPDQFEDVGTASYIIDPESGPFDCVSIVRKHAGISTDFEKSVLSLPGVWKILKSELERHELANLYEKIERPLIPIVSKMERCGVHVDSEYLKEMSHSFTKELLKIEDGIRKITGRELNPRSPKQLSDFLFDKLKLPSVSKTKTGLSTDSYALEQIRALHPIVDLILEHRFISKMLSTYIDVIPSLTDENLRLHCKFDLRATATGRFSSRDPNLQNIPFKNPKAREIRKAFSAPRGKKLLSADYSQIELRLAAHLSGDETFVKAFRDGEDIHARTAAELLSLESEAVGPSERNIAKTVNFGVLYGMSPFKLSKDMNMPLKKARDFIESYFQRFSKIKRWQETLVQEAENSGEIRTFTGRRRIIKGLASKNQKERDRAKRKVFNTPVQGGAADIIKIAMIEIDRVIGDYDAELVLQIHDELLFEVDEKKVEKTADMVQNAMENAVKLDVPLTVSVNWGDNWFDIH